MSHSWQNCWTGKTKASFFHLFLRKIQPILESCDWLKSPTIWLAKSILGHISGTRIFRIWYLFKHTGITIIQTFIIDQIKKKLKNWEKKLNFPILQRTQGFAHFPHFWIKTLFSKNLAPSCTTPHGLLTPYWVRKKTKEPIPKKLPNRRTDRPYSYDPSSHGHGSYKRKCQLRGIVIGNKNKIQYRSAYHTSLTWKFILI